MLHTPWPTTYQHRRIQAHNKGARAHPHAIARKQQAGRQASARTRIQAKETIRQLLDGGRASSRPETTDTAGAEEHPKGGGGGLKTSPRLASSGMGVNCQPRDAVERKPGVPPTATPSIRVVRLHPTPPRHRPMTPPAHEVATRIARRHAAGRRRQGPGAGAGAATATARERRPAAESRRGARGRRRTRAAESDTAEARSCPRQSTPAIRPPAPLRARARSETEGQAGQSVACASESRARINGRMRLEGPLGGGAEGGGARTSCTRRRSGTPP